MEWTHIKDRLKAKNRESVKLLQIKAETHKDTVYDHRLSSGLRWPATTRCSKKWTR